MTLIELLVVLAVVAMLAALILPMRRPIIRNHVQCINNLKQAGLAVILWSGDNNGMFPAGVSRTNGGAMEFTDGPNLFRHFQVLSNVLFTPKVLFCPAENDRSRIVATNFEFFCNSNISFSPALLQATTIRNSCLQATGILRTG